MLATLPINFILGGIEGITGVDNTLTLIFSLAIFLPEWSVLFRRLHDTNRSGWWILIGLIPLIGAIILLVFALLPSDPEANRYGELPEPLK